MKKTLIFAVLLVIGVMLSNKVAGFCKWVDENDVTHISETCPEDVDSTEIDIQVPPSQAQVEEASKRSRRLTETAKAQEDSKAAEQAYFLPRHTPAEINMMEKQRQQSQCDAWKAELAEMERVRAWHEKQIDLKKLLLDNKCK